ncbi:hypothetical protein AAVH_08066 [Aphelenchoides avenae]|nr:hypothetical protein AAVH_08066 [Aphelenchus avenae]
MATGSRMACTSQPKHVKQRQRQEPAWILAGFEIEAPDGDDAGHVSDSKVVDDESASSDNHNSDRKTKTYDPSEDSGF